MKYKFLEVLGLTQKEIDIYTLLISYGALTASEIVNRSNMHRPYVYKTLGLLLNKKIITQGKIGSRKVYIVEPPSTLRKRMADVIDSSYKEIDELEKIYDSPSLETIIKTVQGKTGITSIFSDLVESLKKGDVFYRYTSETDTNHVNTFLPNDYRTIRDKKQLERFVISNWVTAEVKQKRLERATKVIPKSETSFNQDCIQLIYGNKLAFIDIQQLQGVIIENKNLAQFQREIFKLLYKRL